VSPKVSLIIPVYKVSSFIERCACSLFEQTFDDIEYIFVNDCSPDNSIQILEKVIERYPGRRNTIRIINHDNNRGLGAARNTGLNAAKGEYILHVDSDDYIEFEMVERMYNTAVENNADIVVCDYIVQWKFVSKVSAQPYSVNSSEYTRMLLRVEAMSCVWNKMIKKELYDKNNIHSIEGIDMAEDYVLIPRLAYYANKISKVNIPFYHYVQTNKNAYTKSYSHKSISSLVNALDILFFFFNNVSDRELYKNDLMKGILQKKITMLESAPYGLRKTIINLYPDINSNYRSSLVMHEKITSYLSDKKLFNILFVFTKIYFSSLEVLQYLKGRRF